MKFEPLRSLVIEDTRERIHTKNKEVGGERVVLPKAPTTLKVATGRAVDIYREGGRGDTFLYPIYEDVREALQPQHISYETPINRVESFHKINFDGKPRRTFIRVVFM